ncbi:MAG: MBL fold metallo-hydrolase [Ardenticatenaceae bacterium]
MPNSKHYYQITDDIYQVQLPLPFALNIVNCYLLRGDEGWTILDTGLNTPQSQQVWLDTFAALEIKAGDIRQIVLTHYHPDHFGLSGWLQNWAKRSGSGDVPPVLMSHVDLETARLVWWREENNRALSSWPSFWQACGVPAEMADLLHFHIDSTRDLTLPLPSYVESIPLAGTLRMGARNFKILYAPGHTDGQVMFYDPDDQLLLSGDHVLMKITPNISLWPLTRPDPLGRYLASLREFSVLDVRVALPGHRSLITNWGQRLEELLAHHDRRLNKMLAAVEPGSTAYEISRNVFDFNRLTSHEIRFAITETLAHLELMHVDGRLERTQEGVWRYDITK